MVIEKVPIVIRKKTVIEQHPIGKKKAIMKAECTTTVWKRTEVQWIRKSIGEKELKIKMDEK